MQGDFGRGDVIRGKVNFISRAKCRCDVLSFSPGNGDALALDSDMSVSPSLRKGRCLSDEVGNSASFCIA